MLCFCALAAVLWTTAAAAQNEDAFTADRHKQYTVACKGCHEEEQPKTPATEKACLACHKSMEAVAEKTKDRKPNPHSNHVTEAADVECTQCHHAHKADVPMCHQCHAGLQFEKQ
jgi:cytochrome c